MCTSCLNCERILPNYYSALTFSYDSTTGLFTVPPGGDGIYYFSTYLLAQQGELGRVDLMLNDDIMCSTLPDRNNGDLDYAPGSCSAVVDVVAGKI